jgi:hypothetical protein
MTRPLKVVWAIDLRRSPDMLPGRLNCIIVILCALKIWKRYLDDQCAPILIEFHYNRSLPKDRPNRDAMLMFAILLMKLNSLSLYIYNYMLL